MVWRMIPEPANDAVDTERGDSAPEVESEHMRYL